MKNCVLLILIAQFFIIENVNAYAPKSFKLNFTEEHKSLYFKKIKKTSGSIYYQYPSKIRLEIPKPVKTIYVNNGHKGWYYTAAVVKGEPGNVTITRGKPHSLIRIFDMLQNKLKNNDKFTVKKNDDLLVLKFTKVYSQKLKLKKIEFKFEDKTHKKFDSIIEMKITNSNLKTKLFKFSSIVKNIKLNSKTFNFQIPDNTRESR